MKKSSDDLLISILIPVFNGDKYLSEAIESALDQTYKNIEIIVVNDGSTDTTDEIARSYGDKIRYFKKENGGVSTALNLGIKEAKGEYISWLSHDDIYYPNKIERQVKELAKLEEEGGSDAIVMSNLHIIDVEGKIIDKWPIHKVHDVSRFSCPLYPVMKGLVHGCTLLIAKKLIIDAGYFDEKLKTSQDYDMWFKIFPKSNLLFVKDYLVKMRSHPEQGTNSSQSLIESNRIWIKMMSEISDTDKEMIDGSVKNFYRNLQNLMDRVGYKDAADYAGIELDRLS